MLRYMTRIRMHESSRICENSTRQRHTHTGEEAPILNPPPQPHMKSFHASFLTELWFNLPFRNTPKQLPNHVRKLIVHSSAEYPTPISRTGTINVNPNLNTTAQLRPIYFPSYLSKASSKTRVYLRRLIQKVSLNSGSIHGFPKLVSAHTSAGRDTLEDSSVACLGSTQPQVRLRCSSHLSSQPLRY